MRELFWFSFRDHKRKLWRVYFSSRHWCQWLIDENGDPCDGRTCWGVYKIYINVSLPAYETRETCNHEVDHAHLDDSAALRGAEESVIERLSPNVYPTLERFGLRWPPFPAGRDALRRAARRLDKEIDPPLLPDEEEAA